MTKEQFVEHFLTILEDEYGKSMSSDITVSRACEIIGEVFDKQERES